MRFQHSRNSLISYPIIASCAFVPRDDGRVLIVDTPYRGIGLPGGKIDPGETPLETALRELEEETGIKAEEYEQTPFYDGISDTERRVLTFLIIKWSGELRSSHEGYPAWSQPDTLTNPGASYPHYNGEVLKKFNLRP